MFLIDKLLLVAALLMILGILSSKFSARMGLPVLVLFLSLGMLAGHEGVGGIQFDNYTLAHAIGTVALAVILFDGGLRSPRASLLMAWRPAALLATIGVFLTSLITGLFASLVLPLSAMEGLLLGAIVGSTDAAAVFSLLRSGGIYLRPRISAILEIESGANDPMAIFLTLGLVQVLSGDATLGSEIALLFVKQMSLGLAVGIAVGKLAVLLINRINLAAAGLYPVLTAACGILAFGLAAVIGGSGFLAIYVAGIVLGNSKLVFQRGTLLFHDALAWGGQIAMFVVMGLLSQPSALFEVAGSGLLIAGALVLLARPIAVVPLLLPFRFSWRELLFLSWVGLKGAVPIVLAIYPLVFGLTSGTLIFNVVFFVVLVSAIVQGSSLRWAARLLGLQEVHGPEPPLSLEISSLREVDADIVDYPVGEHSRAAGRLIRELALPGGAVVAMIARDRQVIPPRGSTCILPGDHVFMVVDREAREPVSRLFTRAPGQLERIAAEFPLRGSATVGEVAYIYEVNLHAPPELTLDQLIRSLAPNATEGTFMTVGAVSLRVREMRDGKIVTVGLAVMDQNDDEEHHNDASPKERDNPPQDIPPASSG